jgi:hypothetical protein
MYSIDRRRLMEYAGYAFGINGQMAGHSPQKRRCVRAAGSNSELMHHNPDAGQISK